MVSQQGHGKGVFRPKILAKAHAYCSASAAEDIQAVNVLGANDGALEFTNGSSADLPMVQSWGWTTTHGQGCGPSAGWKAVEALRNCPTSPCDSESAFSFSICSSPLLDMLG
mmetsp:Transcript_61934/g.135656  ORF Transcript_61934/g.135656 Transcript_61934/m.135656 type:complete len:112 (-) Transcript_61934:123-458(-)